MRPKDAAVLLREIIRNHEAAILIGPPGCGKTSIVYQAIDGLGWQKRVRQPVIEDPTDLSGLPHMNGNSKAQWYHPQWLPLAGEDNGGPGVIVVDDLLNAPLMVQNSYLQGILEHRVKDTDLDPEWSWVATGNRQEDRAGAHKMSSSLANRFACHIEFDVSNEDWLEWAVPAGVDFRVREFHRRFAGKLFDFDPARRVNATPRSWAALSRLLGFVPEHLRLQAFQGCVGHAAAEFATFLELMDKLPDVDLVLKDASKFPVPTEASVLYALCGALVDRLRKNKSKLVRPFASYVTRLPVEFAHYGVIGAIAIGSDIANPIKVPEMAPWLAENRDLLTQEV